MHHLFDFIKNSSDARLRSVHEGIRQANFRSCPSWCLSSCNLRGTPSVRKVAGRSSVLFVDLEIDCLNYSEH
uniref:Uncharacterized protein n=1 Tax=Angiostrongylus cantonensis TaxID=6313 RepID=A0A0K0DA17_ANGCA